MSTPHSSTDEAEPVRILREYAEASIEAQRVAAMEKQMCGILMRNADAYATAHVRDRSKAEGT